MHKKTRRLRQLAHHAQAGRCYYCHHPIWLTDPTTFARTHNLSITQAQHFHSTAEHLTPPFANESPPIAGIPSPRKARADPCRYTENSQRDPPTKAATPSATHRALTHHASYSVQAPSLRRAHPDANTRESATSRDTSPAAQPNRKHTTHRYRKRPKATSSPRHATHRTSDTISDPRSPTPIDALPPTAPNAESDADDRNNVPRHQWQAQRDE
jgi:hypothetical protein